MACWQNGCAVFQRHAYGLGTEIRCHAQFVGHRCHQHIAWRLQSCLGCCAWFTFLVVCSHRLHTVILRAIGFLAIKEEGIAHDSCDGWHRPRVNRSMSHCRDTRQIIDKRAIAVPPFPHHAAETTIAVAVGIASEIVPSHLVNNQPHHQLRAVQLTNVLHRSLCPTHTCHQGKCANC